VAENRAIKSQVKKVSMSKEILSKEQIKQIAMAMSSDEAGLAEREAGLAAASAAQQRVIKRAWKIKLSAERLSEADKRPRIQRKGDNPLGAEVILKSRVDLKDDNQAAADERAVAYHEAGHCVAAYRLRIRFTGRKALTIIPTETYSGRFIHHCILKDDVEWNASDHNRLRMERSVQALLAGIEAQRRYDETSISYGDGFGNWDGGPDYHEAVNQVSYFTSGSKERELYIELLRLRAQNLVRLDFNWKCIDAIAEALMQNKVLSAKEAIAIIQGTIKNVAGHVPLIGHSTTSA
jgi:hypothetical protein